MKDSLTDVIGELEEFRKKGSLHAALDFEGQFHKPEYVQSFPQYVASGRITLQEAFEAIDKADSIRNYREGSYTDLKCDVALACKNRGISIDTKEVKKMLFDLGFEILNEEGTDFTSKIKRRLIQFGSIAEKALLEVKKMVQGSEFKYGKSNYDELNNAIHEIRYDPSLIVGVH
jgi:hypothetical protein